MSERIPHYFWFKGVDGFLNLQIAKAVSFSGGAALVFFEDDDMDGTGERVLDADEVERLRRYVGAE
jgi:hypothetical protein